MDRFRVPRVRLLSSAALIAVLFAAPGMHGAVVESYSMIGALLMESAGMSSTSPMLLQLDFAAQPDATLILPASSPIAGKWKQRTIDVWKANFRKGFEAELEASNGTPVNCKYAKFPQLVRTGTFLAGAFTARFKFKGSHTIRWTAYVGGNLAP